MVMSCYVIPSLIFFLLLLLRRLKWWMSGTCWNKEVVGHLTFLGS